MREGKSASQEVGNGKGCRQLRYPGVMWITFAGFRIYPLMEREKIGAWPEITLCSIPFPRYTTSGLPECCQDGRLAMLLPYRGDECDQAPRRRSRSTFHCRGRICPSGRQSSGREVSAFRRSSGVPGIPGDDAGLRRAERPSGAGAFLLGLPLYRSRRENGEAGTVDSGGVS